MYVLLIIFDRIKIETWGMVLKCFSHQDASNDMQHDLFRPRDLGLR